jgi:HAMP domain-containing protein/signal transduction histidine kinase/CheY-like chemotaxis protein
VAGVASEEAGRRESGYEAGAAGLGQLLAGLTAVRDGDFSTRLSVDDEGLLGEIAVVFNGMVDQLSLFTSEVTRVAREVGTEGRLGGQAEVPGVSGTWKDLTESVNAMAGNLTSQVRDIAQVATAVATGDLSQKIDVDARGEILELKNTVNTMVDQLSSFAAEVTRVAREVGTDGRLGGQADVPGVAGVWRDLTDSVNFMAGNLTAQVRNIAQVTTAVAKGDLSQKIQVDARGEILELKNTVNTMVDQLSSFAAEVTRVAREVGTDGRLGGQAEVSGVAGVWRELTDSVNFMAGNLTGQVRSIAQVATAVARGDLTRKIDVAANGEILELKTTINTMVDQLSSFAAEVTRVALEVGTEGRLGGQADVVGVSGTWKDLTQSVNVMADNLTAQVRAIAEVTTAVAKGDLTQKIRVDARGEILELKETINTMVDQLSAFADEVTRVARDVGTEGNLGGQATVRGVSGTWKDLTDNVNVMASNLTGQVRSIAHVATAVAKGDLSQKVTIEARGEVAALAGVINLMVDTLSAFADEVTRVAREVGTEGQLGGQARVPNVAGTWKDLTDNVNSMATNLTNQVRNIAQVTTAVAQGDLTRKIDVDARGEILELKTTINTMVDQLSSFAAEVTRVAREVGSEGRLGGQAEVEGVSGTWKRLTENVNELAGNLTRQVRAIAEVTSAVAQGDLTRSITVDASGEVADLKDNINAMVHSLRETTRANSEQDWLKSNLARLSGLMQGQRDLPVVANLVMDELTPLVDAQYGAFYLTEDGTDTPRLRMIGSYGHADETAVRNSFAVGQSLVGQAARSRRTIVVDSLPADYATISSGMGSTSPRALVVLPLVVEEQVLGVIELGSVTPFTALHRDFLERLTETVGVNLNSILANARTDELLAESQRLAAELQDQSGQLQARQEELQRSNAELEEKASLLAAQNKDIEAKNLQIEQARQELEQRAQQLSIASKYKSEFLANMSHELRTPLNSLLILAQLLSQNPGRNLTPKQVEYAGIIHSAGSDLLQLINDILDLSKVEAGKMDLSLERTALRALTDYVEASFRPLTSEKSLDFRVRVAADAPKTLVTDESRLRQVLRNLLSNAVKFTEAGRVELRITCPEEQAVPPALRGRGPVVAFEVADTGIGISDEQLDIIFEAFQQADGTTSRRYGGTGLGLSISREMAQLLGGVITVRSRPGEGSSFTFFLPVAHPAADGLVLEEKSTTEDETAPTTPPASERRLLILEKETRGLLTLVAESAVADLAAADPTGSAVRISNVSQVTEAAAVLALDQQHCIVVELDAADPQVWRFLQALDDDHALRDIPLLVHAQALSTADEKRLKDQAGQRPVDVTASLDELRARIRERLAAQRPAPVTPSAARGTAAAVEVDERLAGRTVLVVDDDVRNVFAITQILELQGMRVLHADNGRTGLDTLRAHPETALVLMDVMMPEMDGYEATAAIRAMPTYATLPVIAVTAKAMPGDRDKSMAAGADAYITKPVDAAALLAAIQEALAL